MWEKDKVQLSTISKLILSDVPNSERKFCKKCRKKRVPTFKEMAVLALLDSFFCYFGQIFLINQVCAKSSTASVPTCTQEEVVLAVVLEKTFSRA